MSTAVTRARRSCLAVPGSSQKFIDKARTLPADQVFLDLEDACAPLAKPGARKTIVAALNEGGWGDRVRVVRVNDWTTEWTYRDVTEVVEGAGANLDAVMLPKVQTPQQVVALGVFLADRGLVAPDGVHDFVVRQGAEIGRPSTLHAGVRTEGGTAVATWVRGAVRAVARGELVALP